MIPDFDEAHRPPDSETFRAAVGTLRQQEAKGRGKYGTDLDGAGLTAAQLLTHAAEESADLLMYLTALKSHATLDQQIAGDWESAYRGACKDRDALAARVAELEAELSATERTADAERERAKRAERLLESESALVAELEASVTYEHNRFKARGGELDRLDERVAELERSLSSTETHRQSLAHELSRAQALDEASLKTIARKDRRIGALEAQLQAQSERHVAATVEYERQAMELEAEVERLQDIGEDLCIHLGAFVGDHECPSMEVIRRWDAATGQDNAAANVRAARAEVQP